MADANVRGNADAAAGELGQVLPIDQGQQQQPESRGVEGVAALLAAAAGNQEPDEGRRESRRDVASGVGDDAPDENQNIIDQELADPITGGDTGALSDPAIGSIQELAERAGISVEELYKLNVPLADGRGVMPLGALKDNVIEGQRVEQMRETFDSQRTEFENEMIRARQELNEIVNLLPELPPGLIAQAKQKHIAQQDKERAALLEVKPDWADPATFQRAQDDIFEVVSEYGYSRADMNLVLDHRLTKMIHDFSVLKKRVAKANARMKEVRDQGGRKGSKRSAPTTRQQQTLFE